MLFYQASLPLSSSTLNRVAGVVRGRRRSIGSRWRVLSPGRQALLTLAYLHKGETYASLAAGFGISTATAARRVHETIDLLAAKATSLPVALRRAKRAGAVYVIVDGTVIRTDRLADDRPYYSGKHRCHGVNMQAITDPHGGLLWISPGMRGAIHDTAAARIWLIGHHLRAAGLVALGDKGYHGLDPDTVLTPYKGRNKTGPKKTHNRRHAKLRAPGERAFAQLKKWHILHKLRCSTHRATNITRAITVLNTYEQTG
ncbi:MAG TPA: transposase family protein [Candidatus Stackebrandtia faecavium]|nr:transposase family protein [Candidatus Stackebrandtia faecavium]